MPFVHGTKLGPYEILALFGVLLRTRGTIAMRRVAIPRSTNRPSRQLVSGVGGGWMKFGRNSVRRPHCH